MNRRAVRYRIRRCCQDCRKWDVLDVDHHHLKGRFTTWDQAMRHVDRLLGPAMCPICFGPPSRCGCANRLEAS